MSSIQINKEEELVDKNVERRRTRTITEKET
jgi:hypothetical protein